MARRMWVLSVLVLLCGACDDSGSDASGGGDAGVLDGSGGDPTGDASANQEAGAGGEDGSTDGATAEGGETDGDGATEAAEGGAGGGNRVSADFTVTVDGTAYTVENCYEQDNATRYGRLRDMGSLHFDLACGDASVVVAIQQPDATASWADHGAAITDGFFVQITDYNSGFLQVAFADTADTFSASIESDLEALTASGTIDAEYTKNGKAVSIEGSWGGTYVDCRGEGPTCTW